MSKRTHKVIDTIYPEDSGAVFVDTESACNRFVEEQQSFGYEVIPLSEEELKIYNENYSINF